MYLSMYILEIELFAIISNTALKKVDEDGIIAIKKEDHGPHPPI